MSIQVRYFLGGCKDPCFRGGQMQVKPGNDTDSRASVNRPCVDIAFSYRIAEGIQITVQVSIPVSSAYIHTKPRFFSKPFTGAIFDSGCQTERKIGFHFIEISTVTYPAVRTVIVAPLRWIRCVKHTRKSVPQVSCFIKMIYTDILFDIPFPTIASVYTEGDWQATLC